MTGYRFLYLLLGLVALISTLALAGTTYQVIATRLDRRKYPPPGRLVDLGGYRLHIHCSGPEASSGPTVVMDAGIGECSLGWGLVQPEIAKFARVCTYDRAGLGWSDPASTPRTSRQIVSDLHASYRAIATSTEYLNTVRHEWAAAAESWSQSRSSKNR